MAKEKAKGSFPFYATGPHHSSKHVDMPRYQRAANSKLWVETVDKEEKLHETLVRLGVRPAEVSYAAREPVVTGRARAQYLTEEQRDSRREYRNMKKQLKLERRLREAMTEEIAGLREAVEQQLAAPALTSAPRLPALQPEQQGEKETSLKHVESRTLRQALKCRAANQDEAFELAQVANQYDRRAPSGSIAPSYSAPDIRNSYDRSQSGTVSWQQSEGDPHNFAKAKARALEAQRIAKQRREEPYQRGFWRKKPDYVERNRLAVAAAKRAEAARHASTWSSAEVREWMKAKKQARVKPGEAAGALLGGVSTTSLGSRFSDKGRDSVKLTARKITNI